MSWLTPKNLAVPLRLIVPNFVPPVCVYGGHQKCPNSGDMVMPQWVKGGVP